MNFKIEKFGFNTKRINYAKHNKNFSPTPHNLNYINRENFYNFYNKKIHKLFNDFFPIISKNESCSLNLKKIIIGEPKRSFNQVKKELGSYEFPIDLTFKFKIHQKQIKIPNVGDQKNLSTLFARWLLQKLGIKNAKLKTKKENIFTFVNQDKNFKGNLEAKFILTKKTDKNIFFDLKFSNEQKVFFGSYPMISKNGTFLINGNIKVVVFQLIRTPGVYFSINEHMKKYEIFSSEFIPRSGSWIDFVIKFVNFKKQKNSENLPVLEIVLDKNRNSNILFTDLLNLFAFDQEKILDLFNNAEEILNSYQYHDQNDNLETIVNRIYNKMSNAPLNITFHQKLQTIFNFFFSKERLFVSDVGRYKLNHKLFVGQSLYNRVLAEDLIDSQTKKIVFNKGTLVNKKVWLQVKQFLLRNDHHLFKLDFAQKKIEEEVKVQIVKVFADNDERKKIIKLVGINPNNKKETLTISDLIAIVSYLLNLSYDVGRIDDIDSLTNRNVRTLDELLEVQFTKGLKKIREDVKKNLNNLSLSSYSYKIFSLINSGPLLNSLREFFNTSQLSQFLDQTNCLTELSNKRRLTLLGEEGLKRESASAKVRDIHPSYAGRICPIETPEGPNIGLIANFAYYASLNEFKFIQTPYWKVEKGQITKEIVYLSALDEEELIIAPPTTPIDDQGNILGDKLTVYLADDLITVTPDEVDYLGYSCQQMFSVPTTCIPFLRHDDANRALMGTNMQKQALPLLISEAPIVATGNEWIIARDSGFANVARSDGEVVYADSQKIEIKNNQNEIEIYENSNFTATNQKTAFFHNNLVSVGAKVKRGQVISDGSSVDKGELAIGKNVLIAFMILKGYNFEDAVIISDRLVRDDVFTSLHVVEYEVRRMRTSLGEERFSNEIPNTTQNSRRLLDQTGIVLVGSEVKPGDILVGKITPRAKVQQTPEDILLNQLFRGREQNVENSSLVVPNGGGGIVQKIEKYSEKDYGENFIADVIDVIKVFIVQKISIKEGDKLANRHGNKGVISRILPQQSMPYLDDGTPIDIIVNPLGVPSRMNIGQLMEMHLAYAADKLNFKASTPIFDGANIDDVRNIMKEANLSPDGKVTLWDGETGKKYDQKIAIGKMYYLKLSHLVETKIHARNVGPYSLITQQPLKGKAQNGGQRFGEMEVWALESYGAAYNLQELLTIKSDDIKGRNRIFHSIINNDTNNFTFDHYPESFNVLISEMRALCLNVEIIDRNKITFDSKKEIAKEEVEE